jgi:hypothetical protein
MELFRRGLPSEKFDPTYPLAPGSAIARPPHLPRGSEVRQRGSDEHKAKRDTCNIEPEDCAGEGDPVSEAIKTAVLTFSAFTFASRQAYQLAYRFQRGAPYDWSWRAFKLRDRLGGRRHGRLSRKPEEIFAAEEVVDAHLATFVDKLNRRRAMRGRPLRVTACATGCVTPASSVTACGTASASKNG